ncbi:hypothetical protein PAXRUDRAFT_305599 [Paxillus rubicundulus Ve08.2h10]|uniref:Uncharacterized protein n=1 Tax=Paxillus rubicundulus Ve08.2h10 TaxID=930991 RepID=A0A0D0CU06_9AGAM|nr:hypothetical protein PAXRUDRAFT_305599 [Paxillus rubicundulus Ve08.2h10]
MLTCLPANRSRTSHTRDDHMNEPRHWVLPTRNIMSISQHHTTKPSSGCHQCLSRHSPHQVFNHVHPEALQFLLSILFYSCFVHVYFLPCMLSHLCI